MKKELLMAATFIMLMSTTALGSVGGDRFIRSIENEIYQGTRTGQLTYNETQTLFNQLDQYEERLWEFSTNRNLSRRETNQLLRMEERLLESLDDLKYNRVTVRTERFQNRPNGYYYGNNRNRGVYYGNARATRRPRVSVNRPRTAPRRGGTVCPPPRRNW